MVDTAGPRVDLQRFAEQGYLVVEGVLDVERDIAPVVAEYEALLEALVDRWLAEGTLTSAYRELPFAERMARVLTATGPAGYQPFDISLPFSGVTDETPIHVGPAVYGLLTAPRLLDAIEQVVGPEILSNPIQHVRIKPPERLLGAEFSTGLVARTDWHQDQGVALPEIDETQMLTVWVPITEATVENGCLCVVPGSHKRGLVTHCPGKSEGRQGLHIPDEVRGSGDVPVPVSRGSVLFLHRQTMHSSLGNQSNGVRWSFDLRYQPVGQPTGRPAFPSCVVRSRHDPATVADSRTWADLWLATRAHLARDPLTGTFNRWTGAEPVCA